ncbi:MAG: ABC transporter ATP-binding protein [Chloroflexi bacterium]|nr:ABC transporter ATP-binding protein [Chloroflexota bacterium]
METVIQTNQLTIQFGGLVAVNKVDFSLQKGEVRGLIGPNGSGKTTMINLITGIYKPTAGDITFQGRKIAGLSPNKITRQGLVRTFQIPRLFGSMTLLENMLIPRFANFSLDYPQHYDAAVKKADGLLELVGISHLRDELAKALSGGQKALLQIARGFMVENISAFMLDEPFAGVNIVVKDTMMKLINQKAAEGISFLLVSHEMTSIRKLCPTVTVLAEGEIIAEGTMDDVTSQEHVIEAYLGG